MISLNFKQLPAIKLYYIPSIFQVPLPSNAFFEPFKINVRKMDPQIWIQQMVL